ncbi:DUF6625 family protein [Pseudomonas fragi]|uniref:DUF6625 family protein n=1 Tax=Pseudomonas fragi TaxID=296 RepID=UPI0015CB8E96|nr:DUF6625 family protein [Pseudomonas fragi]
MKNPPSILFIIPYFGNWPFWMPFFLESCRRNPDINWLIFSDCGAPDNRPKNVAIEGITQAGYYQLVSDRLGIDFAPDDSYKLCDIKPALGYIHADRLEGYDFWGFGDIDVVYGNLREHFTDARLARYQFFSTHERRVAGHLCLMRNTHQYRELFKRIKQWQARFTDKQHHALDEGAFSRIFIKGKNLPQPMFRLLAKLNPLRRRSDFTEAFSTPGGRVKWHDNSYNFPKEWYWEHGHLTNNIDGDRSFPYFHFVCWKRNEWAALPIPDPTQIEHLARQGRWIIDAGGFQ